MAGTSVTRISSGNKPSSVLLIWHEHDIAVGDAPQMLPVGTLAIAFRGLHELVARNPAVLVGDLLHDRDRQTLRTLHGAHELPCRKHELLEKQSVSGSTQTTLPSALTLFEFCALGRIQCNILSN